MSPEHWRQVEGLYYAVLEQGPGIGALLLEKADPELRREVESLLAQPSHNSALEYPAWENSAETLRVGSSLGPYRIEKSIGKGGMGEVWKARDTRLNRAVAIKVSAQQFTDRFEREARAIAALNHPNICQIYDIGPDYLVLEYIEGKPLRGPLPTTECVRVALQVVAALAEAHARGILHCDLKPANIVVTVTGSAKLLDFGLAKRSADAEASQTMAVMGTPAYMAPEQAQGKSVDARSDVFSFGVVLYEMLSGHQAFTRGSPAETLAAIAHDEPAPLDAPPHLTAVVNRCLRKLPGSRFQSMEEVRVALEQATTTWAVNIPSVAVLPFVNMSADKENEYFCDGLAEEILNLLAKIPGLKVIARTSSFAFRGKEQDITKIAEALRVRTILEGSVRRVGSRIRVNAQLIEAESGSNLWSELYERDITDIFAIQDEIGLAISQALRVRLERRIRVADVEAWQNYLKGQYHYLRLTPQSLEKAKEFFEQALAIDPKYAPACSGLAEYYFMSAVLDIKAVGDMAPLAKSSAERALAIDPADSVAHSILAAMAAAFDFDWKVAETQFQKAIATEPVPSMVRLRYAEHYLIPSAQVRPATEQIRLALETDPLSMPLHLCMALCMYFAKQYRETIEYTRRALEIDEDYYLMWNAMGLAQLSAGFAKEAIPSLKRVVDLAPWFADGAWYLATAYHQAGEHERSQEWARRFAGSHSHTYGPAIYYAATGDADEMFESLSRAYRHRDVDLPFIQTQPLFDPWRIDPRFRSLLAKMNLA